MSHAQNTSDRRWLWPCILTITILQVITASSLGLAEDEAYYWCWSQHLATGYFDHPPMIAYFIALGTSIFGDTEFVYEVLKSF